MDLMFMSDECGGEVARKGVKKDLPEQKGGTQEERHFHLHMSGSSISAFHALSSDFLSLSCMQ